MPTTKATISVRLDGTAKQRVERAARILKQSSGAFLGKAGEEEARRVLLEWSIQQHAADRASFSELAADTGLAVEEIMRAGGAGDPDEDIAAFLASCRSVAERNDDPSFLRTGEKVVALLRRERPA